MDPARECTRSFDVFTCGTGRVTQNHVTADGFKLGVWQIAQRAAYRKGMLSPERITRLGQAGMLWDPQDNTWQEGFSKFKRLRPDDTGKRVVTQSYQTHGGYQLGVWVHKQRMARKRGALPKARIALLDKAGMVWDPLELAWEKAFARFEQVPRGASGERRVPQSSRTEDGFRLGLWVSSQRLANKRGTLPPKRLKLLEEAGIIWNPSTQPPDSKSNATKRSKRARPRTSKAGVCREESKDGARRRLQV